MPRDVFGRGVLLGLLRLKAAEAVGLVTNTLEKAYDLTLKDAARCRRALEDCRLSAGQGPLAGFEVVSLDRPGFRVITTLVYNLHVPEESVTAFLGRFAEVLTAGKPEVDSNGFWTGKRQYQVVLKPEPGGWEGLAHPPAFFSIGADRGYCYYSRQPPWCRRCRQSGHADGACGGSGCRICGEEGHQAKDCRKARKCHACASEEHLARDCPVRHGTYAGAAAQRSGSARRKEPPALPTLEEQGMRPTGDVVLELLQEVRHQPLQMDKATVVVEEEEEEEEVEGERPPGHVAAAAMETPGLGGPVQDARVGAAGGVEPRQLRLALEALDVEDTGEASGPSAPEQGARDEVDAMQMPGTPSTPERVAQDGEDAMESPGTLSTPEREALDKEDPMESPGARSAPEQDAQDGVNTVVWPGSRSAPEWGAQGGADAMGLPKTLTTDQNRAFGEAIAGLNTGGLRRDRSPGGLAGHEEDEGFVAEGPAKRQRGLGGQESVQGPPGMEESAEVSDQVGAPELALDLVVVSSASEGDSELDCADPPAVGGAVR